jgi:hypothetical protein
MEPVNMTEPAEMIPPRKKLDSSIAAANWLQTTLTGGSMRRQTVVIETSDGKVMEVVGNFNGTLVILDDFLFEKKDAPKIKLGTGLDSYIWHGKIQHAQSPQEIAVIGQGQMLNPDLKPAKIDTKTKGKFLVLDTCGGHIKTAWGNTDAELIVLDENANNDRKIRKITFGDSVKSLLYYRWVWGQSLSYERRHLLKEIYRHFRKNSQPGTLVGLPVFKAPNDMGLELPNIRKAIAAEKAYRTIMKSDYAHTFLFWDMESGLGDLLCDIRHFCDLNEDVPFEEVERRALMHYDAEIAEEEEFEKEEVTHETAGDSGNRL